MGLRLGNVAHAATGQILQEMSRLVTMMTQETRGGVSEVVSLGRAFFDRFDVVVYRGYRCFPIFVLAIMNVATLGVNFDRHQIANATQIVSSVGAFLSILWWMQQDYQDVQTLEEDIKK